jgi:hypothetical protein
VRYLYIKRQNREGVCEVGECTEAGPVAAVLYGWRGPVGNLRFRQPEQNARELVSVCAKGLESNPKGVETSGDYVAFPESAVPDPGTAEFAEFVIDLYHALAAGDDTLGPIRLALVKLVGSGVGE